MPRVSKVVFFLPFQAFAFFIVVQVKQKEKNFRFVMKLTEQTIKADKQLKKFDFFLCIVDAFFRQMEMFLFFKNKNRQTGLLTQRRVKS